MESGLKESRRYLTILRAVLVSGVIVSFLVLAALTLWSGERATVTEKVLTSFGAAIASLLLLQLLVARDESSQENRERARRITNALVAVSVVFCSAVIAIAQVSQVTALFASLLLVALPVVAWRESGGAALAVGVSGTAATAALLVAGHSASVGIVAISTVGAVGLRLVWQRIIGEAEENARLLRQARTAASSLSEVILRVEQTVHRARIHEMTRERRRVAREIHDSVGYTLTGLIVQLGVIAKLVDHGEAHDRLRNLERIARGALQEVRKEVGTLRAEIRADEIVSYRNRWIQVCEYFAECTGIQVDHEFATNLESVPPHIGDTVYRVIQESLTNAYRHGEATIVDVSMSWKEGLDLILLRVSDNGRGLEQIKPGNGLSGVRERVESLAGSMVIQSEAGRGFDLGVDIPWNGPVRDPSTSGARAEAAV